MTDRTTPTPEQATDWHAYKPTFEQNLQQIPPQRQFIQNAAESFGQSLSQKAKEAGVTPDDIVNKVRSGMQHGYTDAQQANQPVGAGASSGTPRSDR